MLDTGDMAQVDEDGCYTVVGGKKRFLNEYGNRVNLDETERMLKAAFPDAECACAGRDDHLMIFSTGADALPAMRAWLSEKTGLNQSGSIRCIWTPFPRTTRAKPSTGSWRNTMYDVNDLPSLPVYEWDRAKKRAFLDKELTDLTDRHAARCPQYARMRDAWPARRGGL